MLLRTRLTELVVKCAIISILVPGFLPKPNSKATFIAHCFITSPKSGLCGPFGLQKQQNGADPSRKFKLFDGNGPLDRESHFTRANHTPKSKFLAECLERSIISQTTNFAKLDELLESYGNTNLNNTMCNSVYYGDFIHEGTLLQLLFLRRFLSQKFNVVLVIGGGTTLVGDPSYKLRRKRLEPAHFANLLEPEGAAEPDTSREEAITAIATKVLSLPLEADGELITPTVRRITPSEAEIDISAEMCNPYKVLVFNNRDLYRKVNLMEYLETVGTNMNVGRMLARDCVKMRIGETGDADKRTTVNMDLAELMYMSLQALDFVYLARKTNCKIQLGGNDQMGNILSGVELAGRPQQRADALGIHDVLGVTTPLLEDKFGQKISKSGSNCFLKITTKTSPHEFWAHFRSIDDAKVESYIKWFTDVSVGRIEDATAEHYNTGKVRYAHPQVLLADELTGLLYGRRTVDLIHKFCMSKQLEDLEPYLGDREVGAEDFEDFAEFTGCVPHMRVSRHELKEGIDLVEALDRLRVPQFSNAQFHPNKKFIREGAARVNGAVVTDTRHKLTERDLVKLRNGDRKLEYMAVQLGKRKLYFVILDE